MQGLNPLCRAQSLPHTRPHRSMHSHVLMLMCSCAHVLMCSCSCAHAHVLMSLGGGSQPLSQLMSVALSSPVRLGVGAGGRPRTSLPSALISPRTTLPAHLARLPRARTRRTPRATHAPEEHTGQEQVHPLPRKQGGGQTHPDLQLWGTPTALSPDMRGREALTGRAIAHPKDARIRMHSWHGG
jgi:hypothetical protein